MYKTAVYRIEDKQLLELKQTSLGDKENALQQWIWDDPDLLGFNIVLIGREVITASNKRIDLLGVDENLNICVIELKRDKTPREVIAQALDYASWVSTVSWEQLDEICLAKFQETATERIRKHFGTTPNPDEALEPRMIIVASQLDEASERIARFLSERDILINALFFTTFQDGEKQLLARSWLINPEEVDERIAAPKRHAQKHPNSGFWFVNVGIKAGEPARSWTDNRTFGFLSVGGGQKWERMLRNIPVGGNVFAWLNGFGYVGLGEVISQAVPIAEFRQSDGSKLDPASLEKPGIVTEGGGSEYESAIGIKWIKTVDPMHAVKGWHSVMTACALNQPETLSILKAAFSDDVT